MALRCVAGYQAVFNALGERSILCYLTDRVLHTIKDAFQER